MPKRRKRPPFTRPWLSEHEAERSAKRYEALSDWVERRGAEETPAVGMLKEDLVMNDLLLLRLEEQLWTWKEPATDDKKTGRDKELALLEAYGRWQDRRRRAMNEFEDQIARTGTPLGGGLADQLKPLLKKTEGVLDDAIDGTTRQRPQEADAAAE